MINVNVQNIINDTIFLEKKMKKSNIIPYKKYNKNLNKFKKCIVRIVINNEIFGTGVLMALEKEESPFYCLLTNEHVITEKLIESQAEIVILNTQKNKLKIKLNQKERFIRSYLYLGIDATVIQMFPEKNEFSKQLFFKNGDIEKIANNNYEILQNKNIHILQYLEDKNELSYSQGEYLDIHNINEFYHKASTEGGSSGSPIFIFNNDKIIIFGIHKGGNEEKNLGEFINPIIHSLKINSFFYKSKKFKGELIKNKDNMQQGELIIEKENEQKKKKLKYIGELSKYIPHGKGILYSPVKYKGDIINYKVKYCGHFVQGKYQGKGILYYNFKEKTYYEGEFEDNKRHGYGKYYLNNKLKYEGEFKDDEYDGEGTIYYKDGTYYTGKFTQNINNGEGKIYAQDNSIIEEGEFENGISPYNGIIKQIYKKQNLYQLNNILNELFSSCRTILNIIGIETNFKCEHCGCQTDDHHLLKDSEWECHICNKRCKNDCFLNLLK